MPHSTILKSMLQSIINDRHEEASVTMHGYFVAKTKEVAGLGESKMAEKHQDLQDAIMNEFDLDDTDPMVQEIMKYLTDNHDSEKLDSFLYDHFQEDMPYGTQKARDGDPSNWIADRMSEIFKGKY
jgi:hypothetical protein